MKRFSLFLSYLFAVLGFLFTLGMCIALSILGMRGIATVASADRFAILNYTLSYMILLLVLLADACLFLLLENVRQNRIFTQKSFMLLRLIAWSAILAGILSVPLFFTCIREAICIAFVALFLGFVLHVVGQVIKTATDLKEENDATI